MALQITRLGNGAPHGGEIGVNIKDRRESEFIIELPA